jgi:hypothetical protein
MRRRYVYDPATKAMVEVAASRPQALHFIQADLPGYESPASGQWIEGRKARREDMKRTGSRPWEGMDEERREAKRHEARRDAQLDQLAEKMAHKAWDMAPERIRKVFRGK